MGNSSWASPKNSKSKSTSTSNDRGRYRTYSAPMPKKAKPKPTPKAKKPNQNNNQRANLPSEVARPVTPVVKTTPLASNNIQQNEARPSGTLKSGLTPQVADVIKPIAQSKTSQDPKLLREMGVAKKGSKSSLLSINPTEDAPKIKTTMGKVTDGYGVNAAVTAGSAYKGENSPTTQGPSASKTSQDPKENVGFYEGLKNAVGLLFNDPRTEESGRYNQKYWAERLAAGKAAGNTNIQAELKAEQSKLGGSSKSYSQEKVPGYFEPLDHPSQKVNAKLPVEQSSEQQVTDIDNQIKAETDPVKLKALYQRRLRLIRMSRTNTKFAGLLGEADTKKSILTSIM